MIVFINFNNGGLMWQLGPLLLFALPALLNGGVLQLVAGITHVVTALVGDGWLAGLLALLVAAAMVSATVYMWRQVWRGTLSPCTAYAANACSNGHRPPCSSLRRHMRVLFLRTAHASHHSCCWYMYVGLTSTHHRM
ncbi:hypothetical protein COO60DRAFT_543367 [Scenedesmus sp. NREL 46B-D3]|nr:hypothetical protein COO60DRAFT_543367 [Scenedesmus sp. NREL 46B-D3]